jgi:hypothetical protein
VLTRHAESDRTPVRVLDADGGFVSFRDDHRANPVPGILVGARVAGETGPDGPAGNR